MALGLLLVVSGVGASMFGDVARADGAGLLLGGLVALIGAGIERQAGASVLRHQRRTMREMDQQAREAKKAAKKEAKAASR